MKLSFRQGLVSFQQDVNGRPQYLKPSTKTGYVALNISPTPTVVTFAHKGADYLQTFDRSTNLSWGPLVDGNDNYLYWDIDQLTAEVTTGISLLEPVYSSIEPAKTNDQHWFDLNETTMKVWSTRAEKWITKIRAFAGVVENGSTNQISPLNNGSQAGLNVPADAGYIILDSQLRPLRTSTGEFLTSQTPVRVKTTSGTSGVLAKPLNAFVPVRAGENIPAMSVVYFSGEDEVSLASSDPSFVNEKMPVGILQQALAVNEIGDLTQRGELSYDQWDWGNNIGKPLYIDNFGGLTLTRPQGLLAYHVGIVKNKNTIIFGIDAETQPQVYQASAAEMLVSGVQPIIATRSTNQLGEIVTSISIEPSSTLRAGSMSPAQVAALEGVGNRFATIETNITTLNTSKAPSRHTHLVADVADLQPILDAKMNANKNFDDRYAPINLNFDSRYAPLNHSHPISGIINLQSTLDEKANRFGSLVALSSIWESVDRSTATDIGGGQTLSSILSGKAQAVHTHAIDDISDLRTEINSRALINHTHSISQVSNLQPTLDAKAPLAGGAVFTGQLEMSVPPTVPSHLATKAYVDSKLAVPDGEPSAPSLFDLDDTDDPYNGDYATGTLLSWNADTLKWEPDKKMTPLKLSGLTDVDVPRELYFGPLAQFTFTTPLSLSDPLSGYDSILAPEVIEEETDLGQTGMSVTWTDNRPMYVPTSKSMMRLFCDFTDRSEQGVEVSVTRRNRENELTETITLYFSKVEADATEVTMTSNATGQSYAINALMPTLTILDTATEVIVGTIENNVEVEIARIMRAGDADYALPITWSISNSPTVNSPPNETFWHITSGSIDSVFDEEITPAPDGAVLSYSIITNRWEPKTFSSVRNLFELDDVNPPIERAISNFDILAYHEEQEEWSYLSVHDVLRKDNTRGGDTLVYNDAQAEFVTSPKERRTVETIYADGMEASVLPIHANRMVLLNGDDCVFILADDDGFVVGDTITFVSMGEAQSIAGGTNVAILPNGPVSFGSKYSQIQLTLIEKQPGAFTWIAAGFTW